MRSTFGIASLAAAAALSLGLSACGGDKGPGAPSGGHSLAAKGSITGPATEARSDRFEVRGAIGAPPVVSESAKYRLVHKGLRPQVKR